MARMVHLRRVEFVKTQAQAPTTPKFRESRTPKLSTVAQMTKPSQIKTMEFQGQALTQLKMMMVMRARILSLIMPHPSGLSERATPMTNQ